MPKNVYFERKIDSELREWSANGRHKPLLLRGARQVGKSTAVRNLGKSFKNYVEVNFEEDDVARNIFERFNSPQEICRELASHYDADIIAGETLLFLDEIQSCPEALRRLRYFYEKYQELHVIAAGSLLEFAIEKMASFAVGRLETMYLYPFSFEEFMRACGKHVRVKAYRESTPRNHYSDIINDDICQDLKKFLIIGGMPEAVATFVETGSYRDVQNIISHLTDTFKDDFAKYKEKVPDTHINAVFESIPNQAGGKFVYERVLHLNNAQVKQALELLIMAGLVIPVTHSSANGVPIGAGANFKRRKMLPLDTGMFLRMLDFDVTQISLADDFKTINMGALAEMFVGLEILKAQPCNMRQSLYYWHREKRQSSAEVDYVIQKNCRIIPIEVKSGVRGSMQSLRIFMREKNCGTGIRASLENFGTINVNIGGANVDVDIYPMYAISNLIQGSVGEGEIP